MQLVDWDHDASGSIRVPDIIEIDNNGKHWKYVVTNIGFASFCQSDLRVRSFSVWDNEKELEHNKITSIELGPLIEGSAVAPFMGCAAKVIKFSNILLSKGLFSGSAIENFIFPKGVEKIPESFFEDCYNLKQISIPNTVKVIGKSAFAGSALNKIDIPESVEVIQDHAFYGCQSLSKVSLPNNLKEIGYRAFSHTGLIQVCLPKDLQKAKEAFSDCELLSMVTLPIIINDCYHMFYGCNNLRTVEFSQGTTIIPAFVFENKSSLEHIVIPNTVEKIGRCAFRKCGIRELILPNSIIEIGEDAFDGCTQLSRVVLPNSLTRIARSAFNGCNNIRTIEFSQGTTIIPGYVFKDISSLEHIVIPNTVEKIGECAFRKCGIRELILPNSIIEIGEDAFDGCAQLSRVVLPDSLMKIGRSAFQSCPIENIQIPKSVTYIGSSAFDKTKRAEIMCDPKISKNAFGNECEVILNN